MERDSKGKFIKGHIVPQRIKEKMRLAKRGRTPWNKGKKCPQISAKLKGKPNFKMRGANNPHWKGGKTVEDKALRMSLESKEWRRKIFERDAFTCQVCRQVGVYLEAHHIKSWANYPELRFELDNGVALCLDCHSKTDNYKGRKKGNVLK